MAEDKEKLKTFYELFDRRKSVREFTDDPVGLDKLSRLLMVLNRAQSAANRQPWHFIVLEKKDRAEFNEVLTKDGFKNAPVIIVAVADPSQAWVRKYDGKNYAWVDVSIALTEMICVATAEGLGTCWIASLDPEKTGQILGIPSHMEVVGFIALGHPKEPLVKENKVRKPLGEIVHYGKW